MDLFSIIVMKAALLVLVCTWMCVTEHVRAFILVKDVFYNLGPFAICQVFVWL